MEYRLHDIEIGGELKEEESVNVTVSFLVRSLPEVEATKRFDIPQNFISSLKVHEFIKNKYNIPYDINILKITKNAKV